MMRCSLRTEYVLAFLTLADPRGRQGRTPALLNPIFSHFHAVFGENLTKSYTGPSPLQLAPPSSGKSRIHHWFMRIFRKKVGLLHWRIQWGTSKAPGSFFHLHAVFREMGQNNRLATPPLWLAPPPLRIPGTAIKWLFSGVIIYNYHSFIFFSCAHTMYCYNF